MEEKPKSLQDIPKKDIFKVPDGYFEGLEGKINDRLDQKPEGKVVSFYSKHRWKLAGLAAAAAILLLMIFTPGINPSVGKSDVMSLVDEISAEDCMAYLEFSELPVEDLAGTATPEEIDEALGDYLLPEPEFDDEDLEMLYEKYGATSDEKLKSL